MAIGIGISTDEKLPKQREISSNPGSAKTDPRWRSMSVPRAVILVKSPRVSKLLSRLPPEVTEVWALAKELNADSEGLGASELPVDELAGDEADGKVGVESQEQIREGLPEAEVRRTSDSFPRFDVEPFLAASFSRAPPVFCKRITSTMIFFGVSSLDAWHNIRSTTV